MAGSANDDVLNDGVLIVLASSTSSSCNHSSLTKHQTQRVLRRSAKGLSSLALRRISLDLSSLFSPCKYWHQLHRGLIQSEGGRRALSHANTNHNPKTLKTYTVSGSRAHCGSRGEQSRA